MLESNLKNRHSQGRSFLIDFDCLISLFFFTLCVSLAAIKYVNAFEGEGDVSEEAFANSPMVKDFETQ